MFPIKKNIFLFLSLVLNLLALEKIGGRKGREENPLFIFDLRVTNVESRLSFDFFFLLYFFFPLHFNSNKRLRPFSLIFPNS